MPEKKGDNKMPLGDRTGPLGQGAMTGRGLGDCNTANNRYARFGQGRGRGRGFNYMNNRVNFSNATPNLEEEKKYLQSRLDEINKQTEK